MSIEQIKNHATYKAVISDSFGGVVYNVNNRKRYNAGGVEYILKTWDSLTPSQQESAGVLMKGAIHFLRDS